MGGFYMQYLESKLSIESLRCALPVSVGLRRFMLGCHADALLHVIIQPCFFAGLCRRRGWMDPMYECYHDSNGYTCLVLVNGREYQTDLAYESDNLAQENAAMRAFMVCRNFSVNGGMLARNGIVQGLPADQTTRKTRKSRHTSSSHHGHSHSHHHSRRSGHHSSSSSTASLE
ncbi:hypothetical protein B0H67DRAFT_495798 [Lasiosphaeris hirsuta]|uniref:Uncharacterized protein n=1 Tax=Lasiosphaeris hirsuta TaxID=260670 RepID=A0AA40A363_9PEZI|nr:hypothetical protein B0H67DRAFT_495798 [Lasiosphaeris hirsuta]